LFSRLNGELEKIIVDVFEHGPVLGGLGAPETAGGVISNDAPDFLIAAWPVRDLWDLLCKISDYRRKEGSAQKNAKIASIQIDEFVFD
jgi:hypothetical protein